MNKIWATNQKGKLTHGRPSNMTTLDFTGVPFECHAYFVHLHGLEVEETLAKKLEDKKFFDAIINQYISPEFLGGFTSFIGKYSGFPQWVPQLGYKKNKSYMLELYFNKRKNLQFEVNKKSLRLNDLCGHRPLCGRFSSRAKNHTKNGDENFRKNHKEKCLFSVLFL